MRHVIASYKKATTSSSWIAQKLDWSVSESMKIETPRIENSNSIDNGNSLSLLSISDNLTLRKSPPILDFGRALSQALFQGPIDSITQLIDLKADGPLQKAAHFIDAPQPANFASTNWVMQQAGFALGAILPVLAVHKAVSFTLSRNHALRTTLAMTENMAALTTRQALSAGCLRTAEAGITGLIYRGLLTPVQEVEPSMWETRLHNGISGGITFATLTSGVAGLKGISRSISEALPHVSRALNSEVIAGMVSGIPAGVVATNTDSLLSGRGIAPREHQIQSAISFSLLGGGLAYAGGKLRGSENRSNARQKLHDKPEQFEPGHVHDIRIRGTALISEVTNNLQGRPSARSDARPDRVPARVDRLDGPDMKPGILISNKLLTSVGESQTTGVNPLRNSEAQIRLSRKGNRLDVNYDPDLLTEPGAVERLKHAILEEYRACGHKHVDIVILPNTVNASVARAIRSLYDEIRLSGGSLRLSGWTQEYGPILSPFLPANLPGLTISFRPNIHQNQVKVDG